MPRLTTSALDALDAYLRRVWLAWRFIRALGYRPVVAWQKAKR